MTDTEYKPKILVIDDDKRFCETLTSLVARMGYACITALTLQTGMDILGSEMIDLVFLDVHLPDGNGLEYIDRIKTAPSTPEVIMLTGHGDPDGAEIAIQKGVWDYLVKPSSVKNTQLSLTRALKYRKEKINEPAPIILKVNNIIGSSPKLQNCFNIAAQAARSDSNVLITGATGTGKELFAKTIHDNSLRSKENFVIVDCASLTETLVESILFGHKKGAFTGADQDRTGLVKLADKGTLFLDEIGELPVSIQKTFLRVLQEKSFRPVGDTAICQSDFRLIAATNRNLDEMVEEKSFRQDLIFRLCTITLHLPPLKERANDIKALSSFYIGSLCNKYNLPEKSFAPGFFATLQKYTWPGNIRQLFNVLERAYISSGAKEIMYAMDLPQEIRIEVTRSTVSQNSKAIPDNQPETFNQHHISRHISSIPVAKDFMPEAIFTDTSMGLKDFKSSMEKKYLEEIIRHTNKNIKKILSISGLSRSHFYALLKKNNISISQNDSEDPQQNNSKSGSEN